MILLNFGLQDGTHSDFTGQCVILNAEVKPDQAWERRFWEEIYFLDKSRAVTSAENAYVKKRVLSYIRGFGVFFSVFRDF